MRLAVVPDGRTGVEAEGVVASATFVLLLLLLLLLVVLAQRIAAPPSDLALADVVLPETPSLLPRRARLLLVFPVAARIQPRVRHESPVQRATHRMASDNYVRALQALPDLRRGVGVEPGVIRILEWCGVGVKPGVSRVAITIL